MKFHIVEHVSGTWFYHLSETGKSGHPALCGEKAVMHTSIPMTAWGYRGHLGEKYCTACQTLRLKMEQEELAVAAKTDADDSCSVELIPAVIVHFKGQKAEDERVPRDPNDIVGKFMEYCFKEKILSLKNGGGAVGPGIYTMSHSPKDKKNIIAFFKKQGVQIIDYGQKYD